jgi:selenide,water dikinase
LAGGLADFAMRDELASPATRCGGCGGKVGSSVLSSVLKRLPSVKRADVLVGLDSPDDAAVIAVPAGKVNVQTVDFFRSFISDPFLFGKITANHCLADLFAMGAEPQSALAIVAAPFGAEAGVEEQLFQILSGAVEILSAHHAALIGGHTSEGAELAFGLALNGLADPTRLLRKSGMKPGDRLILTKPLGTGTLFAADMQGRVHGRWIESALEQMLVSSSAASRIFLDLGATACTDVTGFGLIGHLAEMTKASGVNVEIRLGAVPFLPGAIETTRRGILSSLHPQNLRLRRAVENYDAVAVDEGCPLLFDPQTAGGLLASLPSAHAESCVRRLKESGYAHAAMIGSVDPRHGEAATGSIRITT